MSLRYYYSQAVLKPLRYGWDIQQVNKWWFYKIEIMMNGRFGLISTKSEYLSVISISVEIYICDGVYFMCHEISSLKRSETGCVTFPGFVVQFGMLQHFSWFCGAIWDATTMSGYFSHECDLVWPKKNPASPINIDGCQLSWQPRHGHLGCQDFIPWQMVTAKD